MRRCRTGGKRGHSTFSLEVALGVVNNLNMPRTRRASQGGYCYHVLNRGNARRTVFHKEGDYASFLKLLHEAGERTPIRLLSYCLMPNHFHLVVWPLHDT